MEDGYSPERIAALSTVPSRRCQDMHMIEDMDAEELRHQIRMQTAVLVEETNRTARLERIVRRFRRRSDGKAGTETDPPAE